MNVKWFRLVVFVAFSALLNSACADKDQFAKKTPGTGGGANKATTKTAEQCKKEGALLSLDQKSCVAQCPADQEAKKTESQSMCVCPDGHRKDPTAKKCVKAVKQNTSTSESENGTTEDDEESSIAALSDSGDFLKVSPVEADLSNADGLKLDDSDPVESTVLDDIIEDIADATKEDDSDEDDAEDDLKKRKKVINKILDDSEDGDLKIKKAKVKINDRNAFTKSSDQVWDLEVLIEYKKNEDSDKEEIKETISHLSHESELKAVAENEDGEMKLHATCLETSCKTIVFILEVEEQRKLVVADRKKSSGDKLKVYKDLNKKKRY